MMSKDAKKRAAMAAVIAYIKSEEEAMAAAMPAMPMMPAVMVVAAAPPRFWGVSGRQDQMAQRRMMQLRALGR